MGLYLCVFDNGDEIDGLDVGAYADFGNFRDCVRDTLEGGAAGSKFPTLMLHSDCDGMWSPKECVRLKDELVLISREFQKLPALRMLSPWQEDLAASLSLPCSSLFDGFIDVDGRPLLSRLIELCEIAIRRSSPIHFQ